MYKYFGEYGNVLWKYKMHFEGMRMHCESILIYFERMQMLSGSMQLRLESIRIHSESMKMHFKSIRIRFQDIRIYFETKRMHLVLLRKKCPYSELFWSAFFSHFPAFGVNTERYYFSVFSPNAGKCGKMRIRITPNTDSFLRSLFTNIVCISSYDVIIPHQAAMVFHNFWMLEESFINCS